MNPSPVTKSEKVNTRRTLFGALECKNLIAIRLAYDIYIFWMSHYRQRWVAQRTGTDNSTKRLPFFHFKLILWKMMELFCGISFLSAFVHRSVTSLILWHVLKHSKSLMKNDFRFYSFAAWVSQESMLMFVTKASRRALWYRLSFWSTRVPWLRSRLTIQFITGTSKRKFRPSFIV